jgi:hypothetical protein
MKMFRLTGFWLVLILLAGCTGKKADTEPSTLPMTDVPKLNIAPDPGMYKVLQVIKRFGNKTMDYLSYPEFKKREATEQNATFNPDVFYDQYVLDLNEKDYWVTVTFRTATRSRRRDSRIRDLMQNFPENAIDMLLKTPANKTFLLSDSNGDGVLDFARPESKQHNQGLTVNIELLKAMQQKYGWILRIIKRHHK